MTNLRKRIANLPMTLNCMTGVHLVTNESDKEAGKGQNETAALESQLFRLEPDAMVSVLQKLTRQL